ncbi:hypothetical protein [Marinicella meishanensis]|uniref:hypothetical protein n=1 Tax=Marinicella meishanensis TaxID=2873263 RepID=UPI001CBC8618|nr:hypothetical protein [Marinicella sp. NBU2979]
MPNNTTKLILTALVLSTAGCNSVPRTELQNLPSLIEIVSFQVPEAQLKLRLSHRNKSTRENNQLSCQLAIKDQPAFAFNAIPVPDMTTYAVETLDIDLRDQTMPAIVPGSAELPYVLDCFLFSENFRTEQIVKRAILYLVPGSNDEYR